MMHGMMEDLQSKHDDLLTKHEELTEKHGDAQSKVHTMVRELSEKHEDAHSKAHTMVKELSERSDAANKSVHHMVAHGQGTLVSQLDEIKQYIADEMTMRESDMNGLTEVLFGQPLAGACSCIAIQDLSKSANPENTLIGELAAVTNSLPTLETKLFQETEKDYNSLICRIESVEKGLVKEQEDRVEEIHRTVEKFTTDVTRMEANIYKELVGDLSLQADVAASAPSSGPGLGVDSTISRSSAVSGCSGSLLFHQGSVQAISPVLDSSDATGGQSLSSAPPPLSNAAIGPGATVALPISSTRPCPPPSQKTGSFAFPASSRAAVPETQQPLYLVRSGASHQRHVFNAAI